MGSQPSIQKIMRWLPLLLPMVVVWVIGLMGMDFGWHWDEGNKVEEVAYTLEQGILLPTYYRKPSLIYWFTLAATVPDIPAYVQQIDFSGGNYDDDRPISLMPDLAQRVRTPEFIRRVRVLFLFISSLSIAATYAFVLKWRNHVLEAFMAAALLAASWEVTYHMRFVAPDGYLMLFTTLTTFFALQYYRHPEQKNWLTFSAVCAGLTVGSKYNGWPIVTVPIVALLFAQNGKFSFGTLWQVFRVVFISGITFVATTPGTILAPEHFLRDVLFEFHHYSQGSVWGTSYDIAPGLSHLRANLEYLALVAFSPYAVVALILFALSIAGLILFAIEDWRQVTIIAIFALVYLLYMSSQSVLFIRNLLPILPILALAAAHSIVRLLQWRKYLVWRSAVSLVLAAVLLANVGYLVYAARTIQQRGQTDFFAPFVDYVEAHPETRFAISNRILAAYTDQNIELPANVVHHGWQEADVYVMRHSEIEWALPADGRRLYIRWFGVHDLNLRYYPHWKGNDHIILLDATQANRHNLLHHYEAAWGTP